MDETPSRLAPKIKAPTFNFIASEGARVPSFETMDRLGSAVAAKFTQGISPHALYDAWFDWAAHLVNAPGRLVELGIEAVNIGARLARFAANGLSEHAEPPFAPQADDRRFSDQGWKRLPYALWQQAFLAQEAWWASATREVRGMTAKNAARVSFVTRQMLDVWSPSNVPWLNPVVIQRTMEESGANLMRGAQNLQEDFWRALAMQPEPTRRARGRQGYRRDAGRGRIPQRADGAHPIQARDRARRWPSRC